MTCQCPPGMLAQGKHNANCPELPDQQHHDCDVTITALRRENDRLKDQLVTAPLPGGFEALTREQHKQMLEFFMYRLGDNLREKLAATLPQAYNAWCGRDIVAVVSVESDRVWKAE